MFRGARRKTDPVESLGFTALQTFYGGPWYGVVEIAATVGVSSARVAQLERRACEKLGRRLLAIRAEVEAR